MKKICIVLLVVLILPGAANAQDYMEVIDGIWGMGENFSVPTFCDIDHDGFVDMIVGYQEGRLAHYRHDVTGSLAFSFVLVTDHFNEIDVGEFATPSFIDLDNDGLLDMMVGGQHGRIFHFEQETVNSFKFNLLNKQFNDIQVGYGSTPHFTNLDNDSLIDMIVGERVGNLNYYEQEAVDSENFVLVDDTLSGIIAATRPRLFTLDLDQDDLLDLIIGGGNGYLEHYEQDTPGSYTFSLISEQFSEIYVGAYSAPYFIDLNDDGLFDLIIGEETGFLNHYIQDGEDIDSFHLITEKFVNDVIDVGRNAAPALADLDNDGLLDMLVGNEDGMLYYYEQNAIGSSLFNFVSDKFCDIDVGAQAAPILTDINNNGLYDLIIGQSMGNLNLYEQDAVGLCSFHLITENLDGISVGRYAAPCIVDLDADGLFDLLVGENNGYLHHYEQVTADSLHFTCISDSLGSLDVGDRSSPCVTDLDDDGLLDLIVGSLSSRVYHYEQTETASDSFNYVAEFFNDVYISSAKPVFVDINHDGLDDYLAGSYLGDIRYFQRIKDTFVDLDGMRTWPEYITLFQNYPNPFNPATTIRYDLSQSARVKVSIHNMHGQTVKILEDTFQQAGTHVLKWDGKDGTGCSLSTGIYFCHIDAQTHKQSIKLLLIK
ncbi:VCBS repeat-containing protein [candidate division KSB1 bacterium]|nr:VCBS repeat-containing protein [candidate division KSB1 bacterium]